MAAKTAYFPYLHRVPGIRELNDVMQGLSFIFTNPEPLFGVQRRNSNKKIGKVDEGTCLTFLPLSVSLNNNDVT